MAALRLPAATASPSPSPSAAPPSVAVTRASTSPANLTHLWCPRRNAQRVAESQVTSKRRFGRVLGAMVSGSGSGATESATTPAALDRDTPLKMVLVSAVALIDDHGRVLLAQRPEGKAMAGLWEFPGGKVEANETPEAALVRELREELTVAVDPSQLQPITFASHTYDKFHLLMPLYGCTNWQGTPMGAEGQALQWVDATRLAEYAMPEADIPLIEPVQQMTAKLTAHTDSET